MNATLKALQNAGDFLADDELLQFLGEILEDFPEGLPESELCAASIAIDELIIGAAMVELWRAGRGKFTWHDGELHFRKAEL